MARRPYGSGSLTIRHGNYYGRWRVGGRLVQRKLGLVRQPGTREGLTRAQAERELRRRIERERVSAPLGRALTVAEAGEHLIDHLKRSGASRPRLASTGRCCGRIRRGTSAISRLTVCSPTTSSGSSPPCAARAPSRRPSTTPSPCSARCSTTACARGGAPPTRCARLTVRPSSRATKSAFSTRQSWRRCCAPPTSPTDRTLFLVAAMTGLRQGELLALRWRDVDWTAGRIRVRRRVSLGALRSPRKGRVPLFGMAPRAD